MNIQTLSKFALLNLKGNKILNIPFVLANSISFAILFIMTSLANNDFVNKRNDFLIYVINMGIMVVIILTFVFFLYTNNFLVKQRNKELALYASLGLEEKHIVMVVAFEYLILMLVIAFFSVIGGFILGKLAFAFLLKLIAVKASLFNYTFSFLALSVNIILLASLYLIINALNIYKFKRYSLIELKTQQTSNETEPKTRYLLIFIGFAFLAGGYYLALTVLGSLKSILYFFIASFCVIVATYCLFVNFSIFYLKRQRKKKEKYYKLNNFLFISGMLKRMKTNAVSLASLTILITVVILSSASTTTIYNGIKKNVKNYIARDYNLRVLIENYDQINELENSMREAAHNHLAPIAKITKDFSYLQTSFHVTIRGEEVLPYQTGQFPEYLIVRSLDYYTNAFQNISLNEDEVLVSSNTTKYKYNKIKIANKTYNVKTIDNIISNSYAVNTALVITKREELIKINKYYSDSYTSNNVIDLNYSYDLLNIEPEKYLSSEKTKELYKFADLQSRHEYQKDINQINGGFVFLGCIVALIFLNGTILVLYFKQMSEAYVDRNAYQVMQRVGLNFNMIKKTLNKQIMWIIFLPLVIALLHCLMASKVLYQLLSLFNTMNYFDFLLPLLISLAIFALVYYIFYKISTRIYYYFLK